ncbi:MAG: hypothetical protein NBV68_02760 [Erythrobacter sp.]|uniref:hypothetical protein n=1 Tax=Erythrobacter sp. TaxID=1042 RepID=UPI0025E04ED9|nr:hypothetical protein [Erythrobacter sp.]MCL9998278.1 hypothetical protein [Erythrobacter sp.]
MAAALAVATLAAPAHAGIAYDTEETCPVGGEKFTYTTTASYTVFGQRPDGKPYGSWRFPLAMPECPSNALVVYREFKPEEIPALAALVASPEYQAMRGETQYFRASWLSARLEPDDRAGAAFLLLQASWEADEDPALKARYQRAFAEAAEKIAPEAEYLDTLALRFRLANARRELGEFDAARAALDSLPLAALDVPEPTDRNADYAVRKNAENRRFLLVQAAALRKVIEAGDTSSTPLDLMGADFAGNACADLIEADAAAPLPERCNDPKVRERTNRVLEYRKARTAEDESMAREVPEQAGDSGVD